MFVVVDVVCFARRFEWNLKSNLSQGWKWRMEKPEPDADKMKQLRWRHRTEQQCLAQKPMFLNGILKCLVQHVVTQIGEAHSILPIRDHPIPSLTAILNSRLLHWFEENAAKAFCCVMPSPTARTTAPCESACRFPLDENRRREDLNQPGCRFHRSLAKDAVRPCREAPVCLATNPSRFHNDGEFPCACCSSFRHRQVALAESESHTRQWLLHKHLLNFGRCVVQFWLGRNFDHAFAEVVAFPSPWENNIEVQQVWNSTQVQWLFRPTKRPKSGPHHAVKAMKATKQQSNVSMMIRKSCNCKAAEAMITANSGAGTVKLCCHVT